MSIDVCDMAYHLHTTSNNVLFSHLAGGTWYRLTEEHVSSEYCKRNRAI